MTRAAIHCHSVREWRRLQARREQVRYSQSQWRAIYAPRITECPRVRGYGPVAGPWAHWQRPTQPPRVYRAVGLTPPPAQAVRQ